LCVELLTVGGLLEYPNIEYPARNLVPGSIFFRPLMNLFRADSDCHRWLGMWALIGAVVLTSKGAERHPALSPEETFPRFQVEEGLRIELVAAEPLVINPVAFVFDERQRMFVVEGRGYPDPVGGNGKTTEGRIALLEDTDGDGRYDRRTEFASGLGYVNGVALWRGGVFVTAAPDILYLKDTDGDGVADVKRVVLTGFDTSKTAQLRVSHPTLGLDGKIYVTSGLTTGKVSSPLYPDRPVVSFSPSDGRFDPDTFEFETIGGRGQFGLAFDAFGRRLITDNRKPIMQGMLEPAHLRRNPYLAFADTAQDVSKVGEEARVFPISGAPVTADFIPKLMATPHTGTFTSACGLVVFGGTALSPDHVGNVFICEPAQNLVQRQRMQSAGASLRADRVNGKDNKEFLATTDIWFRPVFLGNGPDGALYLADMYRREIDHPQYVPEEARGRLDFEGGKDRGRIYRIVRNDYPAGRARSTQANVTNAPRSPVERLSSPEVWERDLGFRTLLEQGGASDADQLVARWKAQTTPETRVMILWALRALNHLSNDVLLQALSDDHPGVREQAVHFAGERAEKSAEVQAALLQKAEDSDARVRFCVAVALGSLPSADVVPALAKIALRDGADRWTRAAVMSGIRSREGAFRQAVAATTASDPRALGLVMQDLARALGAGATPLECAEFLTQMVSVEGDLSWRIPSVLGLAEGLRGRPGSKGLAASRVLTSLLDGDAEKKTLTALQGFFREAGERSRRADVPLDQRIAGVSLLGYSDIAVAEPLLGGLLDAKQSPELQLQVVRALDRIGDPQGGALLISKDNWSRYTPALREAVMAALTSSPAMIHVLFAAVQRGDVRPADISSVRRGQLMKHDDVTVRTEAEAIFKDLEGGDRMAVYRRERDALKEHGDVRRGHAVFLQSCSACHTYNGEGGRVGPDLTGVRNQPSDALLLHILVPNYEVAPSYQTLSLVTQDGRSLSGWLSAESDSSLTLRTAAGTEETVLRSTLTSMNVSALSLMPDGLEQTMQPGDLTHLIAFLKSAR